jgi:hypothetical protein
MHRGGPQGHECFVTFCSGRRDRGQVPHPHHRAHWSHFFVNSGGDDFVAVVSAYSSLVFKPVCSTVSECTSATSAIKYIRCFFLSAIKFSIDGTMTGRVFVIDCRKRSENRRK